MAPPASSKELGFSLFTAPEDEDKKVVAMEANDEAEAELAEDFHPIKNMQVSYFAIPMGIGGLAVALKIAGDWVEQWAQAALLAAGINVDIALLLPEDLTTIQDAWWHTFGMAAFCIYIILFVLLLLKVLLFPANVLEEWNCPVRGNFFFYVFTPMLAVAFLCYDLGHNSLWDPARFARALWWMGSVPIMLLMFVRFGLWSSRKTTPIAASEVTPAWMLAPTALLLSALVAVALPLLPTHERGPNGHTPFNTELFGMSSSTYEIGSFFLLFGAFLWVALFAATLFTSIMAPPKTKTARSTNFFWLMPPCLAGLTYLAVNLAKAADKVAVVAVFNGSYYLTLVLFGGLAVGALCALPAFFTDVSTGEALPYWFDMSHWNLCFPIDLVAASAAMYYQVSGFKVAFVLEVLFVALAFAANAICTLQTIAGIARRRDVFIPERK